jgi:putative transcriptional regulator
LIEVLKNKNLTTRFQILAEIANNGPFIQQKDIAEKLDITPQAVSDYISHLIADNMLVSEGRSSYRITKDGVNWIIKMLKDLAHYNSYVRRAVNNMSVCAAIAETSLKKDQKVGLKMKRGMLFASAENSLPATGITISGARAGEDVGITGIEGIVQLNPGQVTILRIPGIQRGGSRQVNTKTVKQHLADNPFVGAIGLESIAVLNNLGIDSHHYGIIDAAIEAVRSGLNAVVLCVEDETYSLLSRFEQEEIPCTMVDAGKL